MLAKIEKVNSFYMETTDEYQRRLDVLIDSVGDRLGKKCDQITSKNVSRRGSDGLVQLAKSALERVKSERQSVHLKGEDEQGNNVNNTFEDYMSDDEAEPGKSDEKLLIKEADSIKRALIDQHRRTTLLMNYSIMNYTGASC